MTTPDIPRLTARKIDLLLELIEAGQRAPDALELLQAAATLKEHGELARAARCERIARRLLPNLKKDVS